MAKAKAKPKTEPAPDDGAALYTTKIIKAGALVADTKLLLAHWNLAESVNDNLARCRRENLFDKASRSRVEDVLAIFRQRYLGEPDVTAALVALVRHRLPAQSLDRLLYFHAARSDRLLSDFVTDVLVPMRGRGETAVGTDEVRKTLKAWVTAKRTTTAWSDPTLLRVVQGLLSTLRDFGVLEGAANKRIAPSYLPVEAFAYVAAYLRRHHPSGEQLLDAPDWGLFFLSRDGVERFMIEAHQRGFLEYHAAGRVTRITFPTDSLEEYAGVLARRPD